MTTATTIRDEAVHALRAVLHEVRATGPDLHDRRLRDDEVQAVLDAAHALTHALDCVHDALFLRRDQP